ncbi:MAG: AIR synthase related protein [Clostridiales bacterium]|nr:AIR synthase related protein [Clostridiales bacterium]
MRRGKVKESVLRRSVLRQLHNKSVSGSPLYSEDAGLFPLPGKHADGSSGEGLSVAISVNPVEGWALAAQRAVYGAVNSLAAAGAMPQSVAPVILMPEGTEETRLKLLIREMDALCGQEQISLVAGHTAVSPFVRTLVLSVTAMGLWKADSDCMYETGISASVHGHHRQKEGEPGGADRHAFQNPVEDFPDAMRGGLDLVVAGTVGREGAAMIAIEKEKELTDRYAVSYIEQAKHLFDDGSLRTAADLARAAGTVHIHDVREGGIFAGLWELAAAGKVGLTVDLKKIPIRQHTIEVCEHFQLNPYLLRSGGTMIMACENGARVVSSLTEAGITAAVIGQTTEGNDRIIRYDDEIRYLEPPKEDEYYKTIDTAYL